MDSVKSLFSTTEAKATERPADFADSSATPASSANSPAPIVIPPDVEKRIAEVKAEFATTATAEGEDRTSITPDEVRELIESVGGFEQDDVGELLREMFEWIAEARGYQHWKLDQRQELKLSKPLTKVLNGLYKRLLLILPEYIARIVNAIDGAPQLFLNGVVVISPKVMKEQRLVRRMNADVSSSKPEEEKPKPAPVSNGAITVDPHDRIPEVLI